MNLQKIKNLDDKLDEIEAIDAEISALMKENEEIDFKVAEYYWQLDNKNIN